MGVEADKRPPVSVNNKETIDDFSGGLNTTISGSLLNKNEAQIAKDLSFEQKGTILPRRGRTKRYAVPVTQFPCSGLGMLYKQDGTSRLIVTSDREVYFDKPREAIKWTSKEDWDKGTISTYATSADTEGSVTIKVGNRSLLGTKAGELLFGVSGRTYGLRFKPKDTIRIYSLTFTPKQADKTYTVTLWETWNDPVSGTKLKLINFNYVPTAPEIDKPYVTTYKVTPVVLEKDKEYVLSATCNSANAFLQYDNTSVLDPTMFDYVSTVEAADSVTFPDTVVTTYKYIGLDFGYEADSLNFKFETSGELATGTFTGATETSGVISAVLTGTDSVKAETMNTGTLTNVVATATSVVLYDPAYRWSTLIAAGTTRWNQLL